MSYGILSKWGDIVIYKWAVAAKYRKELDRIKAENPEMSDRVAEEKAIAAGFEFAERTQQSGQIEHLGDMQRGEFGSLLTQYRNTQLLQSRIIKRSYD